MLHSHDEFSHLTQSSHLYVYFLRIFLRDAYWEMLARLGEVEREDGMEKLWERGGYVFGMATTVFHPHTHLVHLSIHFRRFNGKCGPGVLRHKN